MSSIHVACYQIPILLSSYCKVKIGFDVDRDQTNCRIPFVPYEQRVYDIWASEPHDRTHSAADDAVETERLNLLSIIGVV